MAGNNISIQSYPSFSLSLCFASQSSQLLTQSISSIRRTSFHNTTSMQLTFRNKSLVIGPLLSLSQYPNCLPTWKSQRQWSRSRRKSMYACRWVRSWALFRNRLKPTQQRTDSSAAVSRSDSKTSPTKLSTWCLPTTSSCKPARTRTSASWWTGRTWCPGIATGHALSGRFEMWGKAIECCWITEVSLTCSK